MRLTLRTLLAWLDDTLSPAEVREIGKQVSESDFAKELVERIHKVTRQRRLTVPPRTGAEAVDPNLVSSYLDNELDPDAVADLEKRCLVSDVHLAEVASVHQVLSLIGQKAKVPIEARERMYQLIKGRESTAPKAGRAAKKPVEREVVSEPIKPWVTPLAPRRKLSEQFGPIAAVFALIGILGWSAWASMSSSTTVASRPSKQPVLVPLVVAPKERAVELAPLTDTEKKAADLADAKKAAAAVPVEIAPVAEAKAAKAFPPGVVAEAEKPSGLLLKYNPETREWDRVVDKGEIKEGERLLSLAPFRATLATTSTKFDIVGETEVVGRETPSSLAAKVDLALGKVLIKGTTPPLPFEVETGESKVTFQPRSDQAVGVERLTRRASGKAEALAPTLRFWVADGTVKLTSAAGVDVTLNGPSSIVLDEPGKWSEPSSEPIPGWVEGKPSDPATVTAGENFLKLFRPERPLISSLVEASEDEDPAICKLAIPALRAVGDVSYVVPILNTRGSKGSHVARKAAILTLRDALAQSPESAKQLGTQLSTDLGDDIATATETLLVGYEPGSATASAAVDKLIQVLATTEDSDVGLRELALDNLMSVTGKTDLAYDAEKPEGPGLAAWEAYGAERRALNESKTDAAAKKGDAATKKGEPAAKKNDAAVKKPEAPPSKPEPSIKKAAAR